jgi:hypothetical protein
MREQQPVNIGKVGDTNFTASLVKKDAWHASKISEMLNPDERILLVAIQSRIRPGVLFLLQMQFTQQIEG